MNSNRRDFLKNSAFVLAGTWIFGRLTWVSRAIAAEFKTPAPVKAADPTKGQAKAMKYAHFAADYKGVKKPTFAKNANCLNCNFYKPDKAGDNWGKCAMIGNSYAYVEGMCQMWMKKPGA